MAALYKAQLPGCKSHQRETSHPGQLSLAIPSWVGTIIPVKPQSKHAQHVTHVVCGITE